MADETCTIDLGIGPEMEEGLELLSKLNEIADISAMDGPLITFAGRQVATLDPTESLKQIEVYAGARGWYLFFIERDRPNWAAVGPNLDSAVADIADASVAAHVRAQLRAAGVVPATT